MHANDPARLAPRRARLAAEARRVSSEFFRQFRRRQNFFSMKICDRHFRRRREKHLLVFQPVHVLFKLRQLRRADHAFAPNQKRRTHFQIAVLARVEIEHELDERPLESRARASISSVGSPFARLPPISLLNLLRSALDCWSAVSALRRSASTRKTSSIFAASSPPRVASRLFTKSGCSRISRISSMAENRQ